MHEVDPLVIQDWLDREKETQQPSLHIEIPFYISPPLDETPPKDLEERGVWIIQM